MKESLSERWSNQSKFEKASVIITLPLSIAVIVAVILGFTHKLSNDICNYVIFICLFITTMLNGITTLRQDKKNAVIIFVCAAVIFACGILLLFL